jgi:hypothetical protein
MELRFLPRESTMGSYRSSDIINLIYDVARLRTILGSRLLLIALINIFLKWRSCIVRKLTKAKMVKIIFEELSSYIVSIKLTNLAPTSG